MDGLQRSRELIATREALANPIRRHEPDGVVSPALEAQIAPNEAKHASRVSVLTEAQGLVHGDRNASYGHPLDDWQRTAGMVSAMLGHKLREPLTAEECAMILCCVKLSRQQNAPRRDNLVDLAGYAECVQWMLDERERRG
jgi:hypothetical protein